MWSQRDLSCARSALNWQSFSLVSVGFLPRGTIGGCDAELPGFGCIAGSIRRCAQHSRSGHRHRRHVAAFAAPRSKLSS